MQDSESQHALVEEREAVQSNKFPMSFIFHLSAPFSVSVFIEQTGGKVVQSWEQQVLVV